MIILGQKYQVYETAQPFDGDIECDGTIDFEERLIEITSFTDSQNKMKIAIHEGGHGLFDRLGLSGSIDPLLEEVWVDTFSAYIVENFELKPKWTLKRR